MERKPIQLTAEQRQELEQFSKSGVHSVRLVNRAKIILMMDTAEGRKAAKQEEIANRIGVSRMSVHVAKQAFLKVDSVSAFLQRKKREIPPVAPKITGEVEAKVIALACSQVTEGYAQWTLRLLADKSVELGIIDSISHATVRNILKKHNLSLI